MSLGIWGLKGPLRSQMQGPNSVTPTSLSLIFSLLPTNSKNDNRGGRKEGPMPSSSYGEKLLPKTGRAVGI